MGANIEYNHRPVDNQAKKELQEYDEQETTYKIGANTHSKSRIATSQFLGLPENDLSGKRFGNFIVINPYIKQNRKKGVSWVVKCDCGYYETRQRKGLTNPNSTSNMCLRCLKVQFLANRNNRDNKY